MCTIICPTPTFVEARGTDDLAVFAEKYGSHGVLLRMDDRALCEVRQLNFETVAHGDGLAIPEEERPAYTRAIWKDARTLSAFQKGAQYNVPVGAKRWVLPTDEMYNVLERLPHLGMI